MPQLPANVEKSAFFPKTYVVYDGKGYVWHARRHPDGQWHAKPAANHPGRTYLPTTIGQTLTAVAQMLALRGKIALSFAAPSTTDAHASAHQ
jgi:hypothetical protein